MKKFLFLIAVVVVLGLVLMATCPDKAAHQEAVKSVASRVVNTEMDQSDIDRNMASIGTVLAVTALDAYLSTNLIIRDYTFCNVGVISYEGEFQMVSVGVLNHVFTLSEDQARELIKKKISFK